MTVKQWLEKKLANPTTSPLLRLFLIGLKAQITRTSSRPYGFYSRLMSVGLSLCFAKWLTGLYQLQMDSKGYNWFIPNYVYKVREESHQYWQLSRLGNKLPTMFSYYKWGETLMFEIDRAGTQTPYHSHPGIENPLSFDSFLHEYNFPASPQRHAQIMLYLKRIKDPYDLQNYLRVKSVNMGDWFRAAYYMIYRELGLTNRWRYDEFVAKPSIYYNWEKLKYAHLMAKDRKLLYQYLDQLTLTEADLLKFFCWIL